MAGMEEQPGVREIDTVEGLRALADPVRLAILAALDTRAPDGALPVMSVKELAQHLGEPQTKLYRHRAGWLSQPSPRCRWRRGRVQVPRSVRTREFQ